MEDATWFHKQTSVKYPKTFLALSTLVLFLSFRFNMPPIVPGGWFDNYQSDSDQLILSPLVTDSLGRTESLLSGNLIGYYKSAAGNEKLLLHDHQSQPLEFDDYTSQAGFARWLLKPFWSVTAKIFENHPKRFLHAFSVIRTVTAVANALALSLLFLWLFSEFPSRHSWMFWVLALFHHDFVIVTGKSVYWQMWSWFAPMLANLWFLKKRFSLPLLFFLNLFLITTKCLMGYEYISTIMVALTLPFVYDAVKSQSWKKLKPCLVASLGAIVGFFLAMAIHGAILYWESYNPIEILSLIVRYRTHAHLGLENVPAILHESLTGSVFHTLEPYLFGEKRLGIYTLILFFSSAAYLGIVGELKNKKTCAFFVMVVVAMLGTLSWHVLAKGHSYFHTHINHVLWYMPTRYLVTMFYAHALDIFRNTFNKWAYGKKCKTFLISALASVFLFYAASHQYTLLYVALVLLLAIQLWEIYRSSPRH